MVVVVLLLLLLLLLLSGHLYDFQIGVPAQRVGFDVLICSHHLCLLLLALLLPLLFLFLRCPEQFRAQKASAFPHVPHCKAQES